MWAFQSSGAVWRSVEVDVLGSPSLIVCTVSVDSERLNEEESELRTRVEVEVDVRTVFVDVQQH